MTVECVIEQKHHRNILGMKGSNVQAITQEHTVSIKFPERGATKTATHPTEGAEENEEEKRERNDVILITGRIENVEAAKQSLMVRLKWLLHMYIIIPL